MPLPGIVFVGGEKHRARSFIHSFDSQHLEVAVRELPLQLCFGAKRILFVESCRDKDACARRASSTTEIDRRTSTPELIMFTFDPCAGSGFSQNIRRLPRLRIDKIQIHFVLCAIQNLRPDHSVADPAKTRDVSLRDRRSAKSSELCPCRHPPRPASPAGFGIANFRIFFVVHRRVRRDQVDEGIGRNLGFVHVQEDDLLCCRATRNNCCAPPTLRHRPNRCRR